MEELSEAADGPFAVFGDGVVIIDVSEEEPLQFGVAFGGFVTETRKTP
jgi:hypothetical protein